MSLADRYFCQWVLPLAVGAFISVTPARAAQETGETVELITQAGSAVVTGLEFSAKSFPLYKFDPLAGASLPSYGIILTGKFIAQGSNLLVGSKSVPLKSEDGAFRLRVPIQGPSTRLTFRSVQPSGQTETLPVEFTFGRWEGFIAAANASAPVPSAKPVKKYSFSAGVAISSNSYTSPFAEKWSHLALTPKLAGHLILSASGKWDAGTNLFFTALPLSSSGPTPATFRYLGINARVGYRLSREDAPWQYSFHGGIYYSTMIVSDDSFGYRSVSGPQLFPSVTRLLTKNRRASAYFKYSPIAGGFQLQSLSSREIGMGASYTFGKYTASLDYADLALSTPDAPTAKNQSINLGISIGF